jgi:hypothetical protein
MINPHFLIISVLILFISFFKIDSEACCRLGPGGSGGGNGLIIENQAFLLEFVEAGLHKKANMNFGPLNNLLDVPNEKVQIVILKYPDHEEYRSVYDTPSFNMLNKILGASSEENAFMFGQKLQGCKDYYRLCLSPQAEITIALVNRFGQTERIEYGMVGDAFLEKLVHLSWVLVDAPLKSIEDANPSVDLINRILLARRDDQKITIYSGIWNEGFGKDKEKISPLNNFNKVGLITHEVFYALTSDQGDITSDRARNINTMIWGFKSYPRYQDLFRKIPGVPAANLNQAYLLSELPLSQELEVETPLLFDQKDVYAISPDTGLLPHRKWFFDYSHSEHSYVEIYNPMNQFDPGTRFPKGLRLQILRIETELMDNWIQTVIYFKNRSGFSNEINRMFVRASAEGKYPITVSEFENTIRGYFKLVK